MDMYQMDPKWCVPSNIDKNPLAWMVSINGLIVDVRNAMMNSNKSIGLIPLLKMNKSKEQRLIANAYTVASVKLPL